MREIKVVLSKNSQLRIYERFPSLAYPAHGDLIETLNKRCPEGRLYESSKFVESYYLDITHPACVFILTTHRNREKDHYIARTVHMRPPRLESKLGKKVSIRWTK